MSKSKENFKKIVTSILKETKESRVVLDEIDKKLKQGDIDYIEDARLATGHGNFILKKYNQIKAITTNQKNNKYNDIKINIKEGDKFISTTADREASLYVNDLRLVRDILEAYVEGANNVMSVCRLEKKEQESEKRISAQL
jgi:hypothetical protein